ncbi:MAG: hypothetical protein QNI99_15145 [Woeseiaceae bacterium]|nr:hypothetical protein [Woeseiaceae bacterium]
MPTKERLLRSLFVLMPCFALSACATSPGNASLGYYSRAPSGEEEFLLGVVNGVYRYNPEETLADMTKYGGHLSAEEISEQSQRYIVRVGINRATGFGSILPFVDDPRWSDYVVLPQGWSHDPFAISEDPNVINVGDVVEVSVVKGRRYDYVIRLLRQCNESPDEEENPDWNIGCITYDEYNDIGYAGEFYFWQPF